jgi:hypothetical protein
VWVVLLSLVCVECFSTWTDKSKQKATPDEQFPHQTDLYYGIQWWGRGNVLHPVVTDTTFLGQGPSKHFDPRKPTVIYSHGWQPGGVTHTGLERLTSHTGVHMADLWIDQGWNVGSFYWTQFADEKDVHIAEEKIWDNCLESGQCRPRAAMTWKDRHGNSHSWKHGSPKSVGQIFYDSVVACLAAADTSNTSNFSLRLVGHSLGGGNVVAAGYKLAQAADAGRIPAALKPARIAMLDPHWSSYHVSDISDRMYDLWHVHNVTLEVLRASAFSSLFKYGNELKSLKPQDAFASFTIIKPAYVDPFMIDWLSGPSEALRHMAAKTAYFSSIDPQNPNREKGPSAATTNEVMNSHMQSGKYWKQVAGAYTETIADDRYEEVSWSEAPPLEGGQLMQWWLGTYGLLAVFIWLSTCVLCVCCCYTKWLARSFKRRRLENSLSQSMVDVVVSEVTEE